MKVIFSDKFLDAISWFMKVGGITLYPFIILREKYRDDSRYINRGKITINHEKIHIKQQQEVIIASLILFIGLNLVLSLVAWWLIPVMAYLSFYVWYILEWFIKIFRYGSPNTAYRKISFEQEAYGNQDNTDYLKTRKNFSWMKYIFK